MRTIAVLALTILLNAACALPAAFSIATLAVDGVSYATSGKSVTDHAISAVANEDCAMWRALQGRPVCGDAVVTETMVAAAPAPGESEVLAVVLGAAPAAGGSIAPETARLPKLYGGQATAGTHDEFEATAAAFAALPELDGSEVPAVVLATATAADGSIVPAAGEFKMPASALAAAPASGGSMVAAAPAPDGSEVMVALAMAPAAGGPMAPETATTEAPTKAETPTEAPAEMPAAAASPAKMPADMAAPRPGPLPATIEPMPAETPARLPKLYGPSPEGYGPQGGGQAATGAPADRGTAAKPVQLAALAVPLPDMEAKPKFGRFVVLASYLKEAHARAAMKLGRAFAPRMARVRVRGRLYYRLVSGPYARGTIGAMRRTLIGEGFPDAWAATLCLDTLRLAPCPTAPLPLNVTSN